MIDKRCGVRSPGVYYCQGILVPGGTRCADHVGVAHHPGEESCENEADKSCLWQTYFCERHDGGRKICAVRINGEDADYGVYCNKVTDPGQERCEAHPKVIIPVNPADWDDMTRMDRTPAEEAHRVLLPKARQLGMSRTHQVLMEAYLQGVKFPSETTFDPEEQGRVVAEILDLDDKNRKFHPEDYAPEADRDLATKLTEARNTVALLTERVATVTQERDEAECGRNRVQAEARSLHVKLDDALFSAETVRVLNRELSKVHLAAVEEAKAARQSREHFFQRMQAAEAEAAHVRGLAKAAESEEIRLQGLLMEANRRAEQPQKVLRRVSWILFMGMLACLAAAFFTGCTPTNVDPCPGTPGTHCGCRAPKDQCVIPCGSCCPVTPCPVEGCADE